MKKRFLAFALAMVMALASSATLPVSVHTW